jgi:hypothetical protein
VRTNLRIARRCSWRYEWVEALDPDVYAVLCDDLRDEQTADAPG